VGILALVFRGFSYSRKRDTVQVGPLSATVTQRERFAIPPLVGAATIIAGVGLVVVGMRRRK
jgi:hypothetical protein